MKYGHRMMRRMLALGMALILLMPAGTALAESGRAVVTANPLTIYLSPTLSGRSASLDAFSVVNVSDTYGNVARLKNGNAVAYANMSGLTMINGNDTAISNRATRVYSQPSLNSASVAIPKGLRMQLLYNAGSFCIVEYEGVVGYALTSHLIIESAAPNSGDVVVETWEATVVAESLPVYRSASTTSKKLGTLKAGTGVTVYAQNGAWAYIGRSGNFGFCQLSGLERGAGQGSGDDAPESAIKVTVSAESADVYEKPDSTSKLLGTLPRGTQVNLISTQGSWVYIEYSGRYGYCLVSALTNQSGDDGVVGDIIDGKEPLGTATVIRVSAPVYTAMNTASEYSVLRMGETLSYYGYDSNWVLVGRDDRFGYMLRETLNALNYTELKLEDSGAGVVQLENALLELGYLDSVPSSNYTSLTAAAVSRLQETIGLSPTGNADLATLRILFSGSAPICPLLNITLSSGSKGDSVSRLQSRLLALGYLSRESSVDGNFGNNTAAAVRLFQTAEGLAVTGIADPNTLSLLYSNSAPRLGSTQSPADQTGGSGSSGTGSGNTTAIPDGLASTTSSYYEGMNNAQKLEHVIYTAQQQLGKRYVFGAAGPSTFDCSGLMLYCFKRVGVTLQHSAKGEGYNEAHQKVSARSSLVRGDMVFFNTVSDGDLCDHVGIYLGRDYVLHASSGAGKVTISTIASGYYNRVFSWGRRVLNT